MLFVPEIVALSYILAVVTPKLTFNDDCFVTSSPPLFVAYWSVTHAYSLGYHAHGHSCRIISLVFETILFLLTLVKFLVAVKQGWGRRPVMREFVTDGTWAYMLIFGTCTIVSACGAACHRCDLVTMLVNSMLYKLVHSPLAGICFTCVVPKRIYCPTFLLMVLVFHPDGCCRCCPSQ